MLDEVFAHVREFPIDRDFLSQHELDLAEKATTSLYPWRGQFSPGLVSLLLDAYGGEDAVVLDPFVGSGTTLFEAAKKGLACYGAEINPAALQLAGMVRFANLRERDRMRLLERAETLFEKHMGGFLPVDLFRQHHESLTTNNDLRTAISELLKEATEDALLLNFVVTTIMLGTSNGGSLEATSLRNAISKNRLIVLRIPYSDKPCKVIGSDARNLPLPDGSPNLVVTSPPYINVFNYHQNYRKAMELMGWRPLQVARSELGSNRKHRGNRFMTVVQYCMDLAQVFTELKRVLAPDGVAIFVIGRESRVRDVPFNNARLLALTAIGEGGFSLKRWQERKFTNRFGEAIYEDLITLAPNRETTHAPSAEFGREVGTQALTCALEKADGEIRQDVEQAINRAHAIHPSPCYAVLPVNSS